MAVVNQGANTVSVRGLQDLLVGLGINYLSNLFSSTMGNDTDAGRIFGTIFSSGLSSAGNNIYSNIMKKANLTEGLGQNAGASLAGAGAGLAANYIGLGITSLGGNSMLLRGIGQGVATGLGSFGGQVLSNIIKGKEALTGFKTTKDTINAINTAKKLGDTQKAAKLASAAKFANTSNIVGLAGSVVGTGLQAAFGSSKEYEGKYGNITQGMDTAYDAIQGAAGFFGPVGMLISGGMALNKGLSNVFGSTSGMTVQDAILGSAFMPAPVKWLNMAGANTTGTFNNLSWLNTERTNSFMGNAFGNLSDKFDKAREEAGKTYGTFSKSAYKKALDNLDFANTAWGLILRMTDQNEYQNIRSQDMSSINNLRYALNIQGGLSPLYRGKQGMKILNNATNHKIGMRLLSGAALIDNKAMILSALGGIVNNTIGLKIE